MSYSSYGNHYIKYGKVVKSSIDQGSQPIINLPNPINPQDAVPKSYVDALLSPSTQFPKIPFSLNGTNTTQILSDLIGIKTIIVFPETSNPEAPMAIFNIAKNNQNINSIGQRDLSTSGINTQERLKMVWNASTGIEVFKTGLNYDGDYCAVVLETLTPVTLTTLNFVLNGTTSVSIDGDLSGAKTVIISTNIPNGPYAKFEALKNTPSISGQVHRIISMSGGGSDTVLKASWGINSTLSISKSNTFFDGTYTATFLYS